MAAGASEARLPAPRLLASGRARALLVPAVVSVVALAAAATTAVVAGTASAVSGRASRRQQASAQQAAATPVSSPSPGDLVFFGSPAYHVGIYVSPGRMIDAQRPGTVIGNHSIWTQPSMYGRI